MKKIFTFVAAVMMATMTFAEVSYEYNGGWANPYGWQNKQDIYASMNALWNAFAKVPADNAHYTWLPLDSCAGDVAKGIPTASNLSADGTGYRLDGVMFEAEDVNTAEDKQVLAISTTEIIYPYLRAAVSSLTANAFINPMMLTAPGSMSRYFSMASSPAKDRRAELICEESSFVLNFLSPGIMSR